MAVHYRDASGAPVVIPVEAAVAHPRLPPRRDPGPRPIDRRRARPDRPAARPALRRRGARLGRRPRRSAIAVILSGFGSTREGDWKSGGTLRSVTLAVRAPASPVLVWAADPRRPACRRLLGRFRRADLVGGRRDRRRHRRLGAGAARPRLRRPDAGPAARAAQRLDRRSQAEARRPVFNNDPPARSRGSRSADGDYYIDFTFEVNIRARQACCLRWRKPFADDTNWRPSP